MLFSALFETTNETVVKKSNNQIQEACKIKAHIPTNKKKTTYKNVIIKSRKHATSKHISQRGDVVFQ